MNLILLNKENLNIKYNATKRTPNKISIENMIDQGLYAWQTCCYTTTKMLLYLFDCKYEGMVLAPDDNLTNFSFIAMYCESNKNGHELCIINYNNKSYVIQSFGEQYMIKIDTYDDIKKTIEEIYNGNLKYYEKFFMTNKFSQSIKNFQIKMYTTHFNFDEIENKINFLCN